MSDTDPTHTAENDAAYSGRAGRSAAAFAGALSAMHENLGRLQGHLNNKDANDIDNARVYLEAAFWKLETVLARQSAASVTPEADHE